MKPATRILASAFLIAAITPAIVAQGVTKPSPAPPSSDIPGPQLIAWSALQKPQPLLTEPASEPDQGERLGPQPDQAAKPSVQRKPVTAADPGATEKDKIQLHR
jgi:hypothetical protein